MNDLAIVGSSLRRHPEQRIAWTAFAAALLAADVALAATRPPWDRFILAIVGALAFGGLAAKSGHGADAIGLRLAPAQGARYWIKVTLALGAALVGVFVVTLLILRASGAAIPVPVWTHDRAQLEARLVAQIWLYPFHEEVIYRLVLAGILAAWFRPWITVLIATVAFAGLHWLYGNPAPDNQLAGFVLTWAFLKSRSLFVPIALHALGNSCGIAFVLATA